MDKGKTHGILWWKKHWISICSRHHEYKQDCSACNTGNWDTSGAMFFDRLIHKLFPKIWLWWVNRPNSKQRKQVEKFFPNLKRKQDGDTK